MAMKFYTEDEALDKVIGTKDTPERIEYDAQMGVFLIGEAIRQARQQQGMTQEELGNMIGVKKSQISRIENGCDVTFKTVGRIFRAMGLDAILDLGAVGRVAVF